MLEIFLVYKLCQSIGRMMRAKGRSAGGYQFLAVMLWLIGEFTGALAGLLLELGNGAYLTCLLGAAFGALVAYTLASAMPSRVATSAAVEQVFD